MGKGSTAPAPPDPYKTASAEAQFNRLDTYSPSGAGIRYGYTDPATGQFKQGVAPQGSQSAVSRVESPWERQIRTALEPASVDLTNRIISDNISNMPNAPRAQDRSTVAQSIYDRTLSMMQPSIDRSNSRLLTNLQARGLPVGSDAFKEAMAEQQRNTQDTLARLAMDADIAAGQEQSRLFSLDAAARQGAIAELVAAMGGSYNPPSAVPSGSAPGVNYSGLVGQQYQQQMAQHNQNQANRASMASTLGGLGAAMLMKSDRVFKRDVRLIGYRNGFPLYAWRYIWDRPGTVRRGYMVQDVRRAMPAAVQRIGRWFFLDYSQLPQVD